MTLIIEDMAVSFGGAPLFRGVDFELKPGELAIIVGPSGVGKTTLLRAIAGQVPFEGSIRALEEKIVPFRRIPPGLILVPQQPALWQHLQIIENVALVNRLCTGASREEARDHAWKLLSSLGVEHTALRFPYSLSGGERQRASLARSLAANPRLLLLDEVTSAIDFARRKIVAKTIMRRQEEGTAILLVTHDLYTAVDLAGTEYELWPAGLRPIDLSGLVRRIKTDENSYSTD